MAKQEAPYTIRVGRGIKAKVWTNNGSKSTWYNVTFARSYRDEDGNYQDADSFGRDDLLHLARAAEKAFDFINGQIQADEEKFNQPGRSGGRLPSPRRFMVSAQTQPHPPLAPFEELLTRFLPPHPALSHEGRGDIGQLSLERCLPAASIVPTVAEIRAASGDMLHESTKTELMRRMVGIADGDTGG